MILYDVVSIYSDGERILEQSYATKAQAELGLIRVQDWREYQDEMPKIVIEEREVNIARHSPYKG